MKKSRRRVLVGCAAIPITLILFPVVVVLIGALLNFRTAAETDIGSSGLLRQAPPPLIEPRTLKIVTFNIANAYLFTSNRRERMLGVAEALAKLDPDIVGLQEAFVQEEREILIEALAKTRLKHHTWYPCATVGNGLFTLSAWPIVESIFLRYEASNPWYRIWEGDWWAGKGVGLARVELPNGSIVDFYNTHAQSDRTHRDAYLQIRIAQMEEALAFIKTTHLPTAAGFFVGDFNTVLDAPDFRVILDGLNLTRVMNVDSDIDHILAIGNPHYSFSTESSDTITGTVQGAHGSIFIGRPPSLKEIFNARFGPGEETPLSDHRGYVTSVTVRPEAGAAPDSHLDGAAEDHIPDSV